MINGAIVGIVLDNKDPDGMHRVKVQFPVESGEGLNSSWVRMSSPMAGKLRGLVMLPDVGTEVVMMYAYRSMTPYIIGAVYNGGADKPEPYKNDDGNNDKRVIWSRNDHMILFDDTPGAENVGIAAKAPTRLQINSGPVYQLFDSSKKEIKEYSDKDYIWEAAETISIKCKDFKLETDATIAIEATQDAIFKSGSSTKIESSADQTYKAGSVSVNGAAPVPDPSPAKASPAHKHPPTK